MKTEEIEKIRNVRNVITSLKIEQDIQYEQLRKDLSIIPYTNLDDWLFDAVYNSDTEEEFKKSIESFVAARQGS
jgi:hypothetical protein